MRSLTASWVLVGLLLLFATSAIAATPLQGEIGQEEPAVAPGIEVAVPTSLVITTTTAAVETTTSGVVTTSTVVGSGTVASPVRGLADDGPDQKEHRDDPSEIASPRGTAVPKAPQAGGAPSEPRSDAGPSGEMASPVTPESDAEKSSIAPIDMVLEAVMDDDEIQTFSESLFVTPQSGLMVTFATSVESISWTIQSAAVLGLLAALLVTLGLSRSSPQLPDSEDS